jgi:hypothetical protein
MAKMRKRCTKCPRRVDCLINFETCLIESEKIAKLQKLIDYLPHNNTRKRLLIKRIAARFEDEFNGSRAQRRGEAKLFILKHASKLRGYYLTSNRNALQAHR